jgi:diguanylate cyclase (GGDEF)-like protein/PAS domain S-box-containing protein
MQTPTRAFQALHEVAVAAAGLRDPNALADLVVDRARDLLEADAAALYWFFPESGTLHTLAHNDPDQDGAEPPFKPGEGAAGRAYAEAAAVRVDDYRGWPQALPSSVGRGIESGLAVPLMVSHRAVGSLGVFNRRTREWSSDDEQLLILFAAQVAPALEAARLIQETIEQAHNFRALHEVAIAAGGLRDLAELGRLVVDRARQLLKSESATLRWWDPATETLRLLASIPAVEGANGERIVAGQGSLGQAFERQEPAIIENYAEAPGTVDWAIKEGIKSAMGVPVMAREEPLGALGVATYEDRHYTRQDVQLLTLLAAQVGPALEAARLYHESERQRREAEAMGIEAAARSAELAAVIDHIPDGVYVTDLEGRIVLMNPAGNAMMGGGKPSGDIGAGIGAYTILDPKTRQPVPRQELAMSRALRGENVSRVESIVQREGVSDIWLESSAVPLHNAGGTLTGALVVFSDVTRERNLVVELADSELKLRTIFDQAPIGLARVDLEGNIQEANLSLRTMLGYPEGELIGLRFDRVLSTPGGSELDLISDFLKGDRDRYTAELPVRRRDGTQRWGSVSLSLVRGPKHERLYLIGMLEDISDRKAQTELLEYQTLHDSLTDLPNRTLLHDRLQQAILTAQREHRQLALLIMDLNRFKEVNDTFGHHLGDVLLQQVGPRIMAQLRESDTVARLGGDEFAVVLPTADDETGATLAARRLLKALEEPFVIEDRRFEVGGSIGIAISPQHGADPATLMRRADIAMYVAKRTRSGYAVYSPEDDKHSPGRLSLMGELRDALQGDALVLHYQPQVSLPAGTVTGVEALIRWQHPRHGLMPPDEFLTVAEETGLIVGVSEWALNAALEQSRSWSGRAELPVAVNLSMQNLQDPNLPALIATLLERHSVRAEALKIEVTETALMADPQRSAEIFAQLRAMGVKISIDDFGSGYSSLAYLKQLPVDELKIDRSFVIGITPSAEEVAIVRSAIEIGHSLGLTVIAEGVETQAAWDILAELGCDMVQGYLVTRPLPARQLGRWLSAGWTPRARDLMP